MKNKFFRRLCTLLLTAAMWLTLAAPAWAAATDVASVTITGAQTASVGTPVELQAVISPEGTGYTNIRWECSAPNAPAASIRQDAADPTKAVLTAGLTGQVTVTVTVDDLQPASYTVEFIPSVTLSPSTLTLQTGGTGLLTAAVLPAGQTVIWESSDTAVASVENGRVTAVGPGTATITATVQYGSAANQKVSAACSLTVDGIPVEGITISTYNDTNNPMILERYRSDRIHYSISPPDASNQRVTWSSDNTAVATVDSDGTVSAVGVGEAMITARAGAAEARCRVEVSGVVLSTYSLDLILGGRNVTPSYTAYGNAVAKQGATLQRYWQSSDPLIAAVNRTTGMITPRGVGAAEITFTYVVNGVSYGISPIHVTVTEDTSSILLDDATAGAPYLFSEILRELNAKSPYGDLLYITNLQVPTREGVLYYNHVSADDTGFGVGATERYYYDADTIGERSMDGLTFVPNSDFNGESTITFTAFTTDKRTYNGKIRLTVTGSGDVTFITKTGQPLVLSPANFIAACRAETGRELAYISFVLPEESKGQFCYGYSGGEYRYEVTEGEQYFLSRAPYLNQVTYIPAEYYMGTFRLPFHGTDTAGVSFTGQLNMIVASNSGEGGRKELTYDAMRGTNVDFGRFDFRAVCQQVLGSSESLSYVRFTPPSSAAGTLYYNYRSSNSYDSLVNANTRYYPSRTPKLSDLTFVPAPGRVEPVAIDFEGYSSSGRSFRGTVRIYFRDVGGDGAITYAASSGQAVPFESADFSDLCQEITGRELNYITFQYLPETWEGTLYRNYNGGSSIGTKVATKDKIYRSALANVVFAPKSDFVGTVELEFTGYASGTGERFTGVVRIEVEEGNTSLHYNVYSGSSVYFKADDFNAICRQATGGKLNYVRFQLPTSTQGTLYYRYNSNSTSKNKVGSTSNYYYSTSGSNRLDNVFFTAATNYTGTVSLGYTGFSTSGASFAGTVEISVSYHYGTTLDYTATSLPFTIPGTDLSSACRYVLNKELSYILFSSLPKEEQGRLYYDYVGYGTGTEVKLTNKYYEAKSPYLSRIVFVPKEGYEGTVSLPYTAYDTRGDTVSGVVQITVTKPETSVFTDMGGHIWAIPSVEFLNSSGIVEGVGANRYDPAGNIKRGDFVLMLYRLYNFPAAGTKSFADVAENSYYAQAIASAKAKGVVTGERNWFYPDEAITRQDAMLFLRNAMRAAGKAVPAGNTAELYAFTDYNAVSSEARSAVISMIHLNIIRGDDYRRLNPTSPISRAEAAAILHRVMTL